MAIHPKHHHERVRLEQQLCLWLGLPYWSIVPYHGDHCLWEIVGVCGCLDPYNDNAQSFAAIGTVWMGSSKYRYLVYSLSVVCWCTGIWNASVSNLLFSGSPSFNYFSVFHVGRSSGVACTYCHSRCTGTK